MTTISERNGIRVLSVGDGDDAFATVRDFTDLIGEALGEQAGLVAIPAARIGEDFYRLRTGVAGEVLQKFVNYRIKLAIIGDVSQWVAESNAFRDLLIELERGTDVFVVPDAAGLEARLSSLPAA